MKEKKSSVLDQVSPDLLVPPHVVDKLVDLFADSWQPDTIQQAQLSVHLTECSPCRTFLIALLQKEEHNTKSSSNPDTSINDLLMQFVRLHHKIESQEYEQLGAYSEAIVAKGSKEANKRFPEMAEHVKRCPGCRATLDETLAFLKESEETY